MERPESFSDVIMDLTFQRLHGGPDSEAKRDAMRRLFEAACVSFAENKRHGSRRP